MDEAAAPASVSERKVARSRWIDRSLNIAALCAVVLAAASVIWSASVASQKASEGYQPGSAFAGPPPFNPSAAPLTLIVWLDTECVPCQESVPFYKRLTSNRHRARVVFMAAQAAGELGTFLKTHQITADTILSTNESYLGFKGTPTLLLIGQDSVIRNVWYGRRDGPAQEEEVLKLLD